MRRVGAHILAAEAAPEFIDQGRPERVGVAERDNIAREIDGIIGAVADLVPRKGRSGPRHAVIPIRYRTVEPFREQAALFTQLMIDFQ